MLILSPLKSFAPGLDAGTGYVANLAGPPVADGAACIMNALAVLGDPVAKRAAPDNVIPPIATGNIDCTF